MAALKDWKIFQFQIPLVMGGVRKGYVLRLGKDQWGEIAPLPGRSKETLSQALNQLVRMLSIGNWSEKLFPSVQLGLESALALPTPQISAQLYAFLHGTPEEIRFQAEKAHAQGYRAAKVKIAHLKLDQAIETLRFLQGKFSLRVDCNNVYRFEEALSLFSHFESGAFEYIEDPTHEVFRLEEFPYPFALDENLLLKNYPQLYGFVLKPTILGGRKGCAPFINFAKKNNLKIVFSPAYESGLGLLQIISLAHSFGLLDEPIGLDTHRYLSTDILLPKIDFSTPKFVLSSFPQVNVKCLKEIAHGKCILPHL